MTSTARRSREIAFVDASAWIALLVPSDVHHRRARDFFQAISARSQLVTSNYVIAETVTWLIYHERRRTAREFRRMLDAAEATRLLSVAWVTPQVHQEAWDYLERYDDQDFSFSDCSSFVIIKAGLVDYVFGFDEHFRVVGLDLRP